MRTLEHKQRTFEFSRRSKNTSDHSYVAWMFDNNVGYMLFVQRHEANIYRYYVIQNEVYGIFQSMVPKVRPR